MPIKLNNQYNNAQKKYSQKKNTTQIQTTVCEGERCFSDPDRHLRRASARENRRRRTNVHGSSSSACVCEGDGSEPPSARENGRGRTMASQIQTAISAHESQSSPPTNTETGVSAYEHRTVALGGRLRWVCEGGRAVGGRGSPQIRRAVGWTL